MKTFRFFRLKKSYYDNHTLLRDDFEPMKGQHNAENISYKSARGSEAKEALIACLKPEL